jgi:hypothetical protein
VVGANRGPHDNPFGLTACGPTGAVPGAGNPFNIGGLVFLQALEPGEVFRNEVDLRKWFTFSAHSRSGAAWQKWIEAHFVPHASEFTLIHFGEGAHARIRATETT